jgi:hypothetical protein
MRIGNGFGSLGRIGWGKVDAKKADITFTKGKAELFVLNS